MLAADRLMSFDEGGRASVL
uniref:Uncharacterized protein n=1 Tax=Arundo donax TaxID=35708 RepID=A0A0A8ZD89_ARUDO